MENHVTETALGTIHRTET